MSPKSIIVALVLFAILLTACQSAAQQPAQPTSAPTQVPPTKVESTATPIPSPTQTAAPSNTPLPTATPGPVVVKDDFSSQSDIWGKCDHCEWKDGALAFGPYPPATGGGDADQIFYVVCQACGLHTYYKVSADVTFMEGYGDRTFGILAGLSDDKKSIAAGTVTTFQHALYESFDYVTNQWGGTIFKKYSAVHPGRTTNHVEVLIQPSGSGEADIIVSVNGKNLVTLNHQSVQPTWAGLYLGWHSVGVSYDNFQYEEIPAE